MVSNPVIIFPRQNTHTPFQSPRHLEIKVLLDKSKMKHLSPVLEHTASSFTLFLPLWVCWRQQLQRRSPRRPRQQAVTRWEAARFLSRHCHTQDHPTYTRGIQSPPGDKRQQGKVPTVRHSSQPPLTNYPAMRRCHNRQDD